MDKEYKDIIQQLAGAWRLVSSEFRTSGSDVIYPLGEDALGQVIFTENGYMSAQLMRLNRPDLISGDQSSGTPEEIRAAFGGFVSYYGPFKLDLGLRKLITCVEGSMFPNWVGKDQERFFEITENQLILRTTPFAFGDIEFTGVLVWERR